MDSPEKLPRTQESKKQKIQEFKEQGSLLRTEA
jgi:hypothetical protein